MPKIAISEKARFKYISNLNHLLHSTTSHVWEQIMNKHNTFVLDCIEDNKGESFFSENNFKWWLKCESCYHFHHILLFQSKQISRSEWTYLFFFINHYFKYLPQKGVLKISMLFNLVDPCTMLCNTIQMVNTVQYMDLPYMMQKVSHYDQKNLLRLPTRTIKQRSLIIPQESVRMIRTSKLFWLQVL